MAKTWSIVMPRVMVLCDDKVMEHFDDKCVVHCEEKGREHFDDRVMQQFDEKCNGVL